MYNYKHPYFSDIESLMKDQRGGEGEKKPNLRRDVRIRGQRYGYDRKNDR